MSLDRYMNTPVNWDLETEIRKATYTVMNFCEEGVLQESGGKSPEEMLSGASGLAFITVMKAVSTGQRSPTPLNRPTALRTNHIPRTNHVSEPQGFFFSGRVGSGLVVNWNVAHRLAH